MTPEEFVNFLKEVKTPDTNTFNFYQAGYRDSIPADNLLLYLKKMQKISPSMLLVGEAPGYKGCKLTGVPFSSEYHILHEDFFKEGFKIFDPENIDKEMSACAIWDILRETSNIPLIWNICPFHPLTPDGKNGKPKSKDIALGKMILDKLLSIFDITQIYCIGRTSANSLSSHPLFKGYIRHPSHGGRSQCIRQLRDILKDCRS